MKLYFIFLIITLSILLFILIIQLLAFKYEWKIHLLKNKKILLNTKKMIFLILGIMISTIFICSINLIYEYWKSAIISIILYLLNSIIMFISNCFKQLFFLQRARLSQGLTPLFSEKYFNIIIPLIIFIKMIIMCIARIIISLLFKYKDKYCDIIYFIEIGFESIITIFLIWLFVYPIYNHRFNTFNTFNTNVIQKSYKSEKVSFNSSNNLLHKFMIINLIF